MCNIISNTSFSSTNDSMTNDLTLQVFFYLFKFFLGLSYNQYLIWLISIKDQVLNLLFALLCAYKWFSIRDWKDMSHHNGMVPHCNTLDLYCDCFCPSVFCIPCFLYLLVLAAVRRGWLNAVTLLVELSFPLLFPTNFVCLDMAFSLQSRDNSCCVCWG